MSNRLIGKCDLISDITSKPNSISDADAITFISFIAKCAFGLGLLLCLQLMVGYGCNMADKKNISMQKKQIFDALYKDLVKHRETVWYSSDPIDHNNCEAYRKIVEHGHDFLPFIVDKIAKGDIYLNQAMSEITKVDVKKYYGVTDKYIGEQEISKLWLRWWDENKSK